MKRPSFTSRSKILVYIKQSSKHKHTYKAWLNFSNAYMKLVICVPIYVLFIIVYILYTKQTFAIVAISLFFPVCPHENAHVRTIQQKRELYILYGVEDAKIFLLEKKCPQQSNSMPSTHLHVEAVRGIWIRLTRVECFVFF